MKKNYSLCIFSCLFSIVAEFLVVLNSVIMGNVIDTASRGDLHHLILNGITMMGILFANNTIFTLSVYLNLKFANAIATNLRTVIVENIFRKPLWAFRKMDDAYYINMLYGDIDKLNVSVYQNYSIEWKFLALFTSSLIMIVQINVSLFLISISFSLLPLVATFILQRTVNKYGIKCSESDESFQRKVTQTIQGYECVKTNGNPTSFLAAFFQPAAILKGKNYVKKETIQTIVYAVVDFVNSLGQLILIITGGYLILMHSITPGELITSIMLSSYVYSGMSNFLETFLERKSCEKIREKVISEAEYAYPPSLESVQHSETSFGITLQYKNVHFSFGDNCIVDDFSFTFEAGKCYGIIGESGKGKTTLMRLALKYYENFGGEILLNNQDIRELSDTFLYHNIGYLNQSEYMFQDTIENNICLYSEEAAIPRKILQQCHLSNLITKSHDRNIGDLGEFLSGGERQRTALARVMLRQPGLIIFDEPLVGLDPESVADIMETIFSMDGITRIIISHNASVLQDSRCSQILTLI